MTRYEKIKSILKEKELDELVRIHNDYCDTSKFYDNMVYLMDEFDDLFGNCSPWELVRMAFYGHEFNPNHDYFTFNGYGNLESFNGLNAEYCPIDVEDIATYMDEYAEAFGVDEVLRLFEETEEEEK